MRTASTLSLVVLTVVGACGPKLPPASPTPTVRPSISREAAPEGAPDTDKKQPESPSSTDFVAPRRNTTAEREVVLHVVDVGTGLGAFVEGPDFTLVYDAGSNDDLGTGDGNRFTAYLNKIRPDLKVIDHVVLSHPHRDHVELLADVIGGYKVGHVWDSGAINPICGYRRFIEAVAGSNSKYHSGARAAGPRSLDFGKQVCGLSPVPTVEHADQIEEGKPIKIGDDATLTFLHVDGEVHGTRFNENSLVMLLSLKNRRVLFMGGLGSRWQKIARRGSQGRIRRGLCACHIPCRR